MANYERAVFISYAWGDEREETVNQIDQALQTRGITIIRDKRDLGYKGLISGFMKRIGEGRCVIVVISDKYLRSPNCMFELVEIAENEQFYDRVFPVVLSDANIYDPVKRIEYIKYWEAKRRELAKAMKPLDPANLQGIRDDIDQYNRIRDKISGITSILKDMNTLTPDMHRDTNFTQLYDALMKRMQYTHGAEEKNYREWLRDETDTIDIRGIGNRTSPGRFLLFDLYIPLHVDKISSAASQNKNQDRLSLEEVLRDQKHTVVVGGPGTGKTTFLRYLARRAVNDLSRPMPLLMQASNWHDYVNYPGSRENEFSSDHLLNYWLNRNEIHRWGFEKRWFEDQLQQGRFQLLLDGLDELPDEAARKRITKIIDSCVKRWPESKWVVTSRPAVFQSFAPLHFVITAIDELEDTDIQKFVNGWVNILYSSNTAFSEAHASYSATLYEHELLQAIRENNDVRFLARNPVMLTAIAVMHWNNMKLPDGKAELYKTIIDWLIRARRDYPRKPNERSALDCYQRLALAMFNQPSGVQTVVGRAWAAEQIAELLPNPENRDKNRVALEFLEYEEINTGIVVSREGGNVAFWHFSFQEYLAAYEIATKTDDEATGWWASLRENLFDPQWIEILRFVPTIFFVTLGRGRVDLFVKRILATRKDNSLTETARVVGFLGSVLLDLSIYHYAIERVEDYISAREQVMRIFARDATGMDFQTRYEAAISLGRWGDPRLAHSEENWIWIPRGIGIIGAQADDPEANNYDEFALANEGPVFEAYSASFEIGKYPVTVQEFVQFINNHGYDTQGFWSTEGWNWRKRNKITKPNHWEDQLEDPNKPVVYVGWFEAEAYCEWLTSRHKEMIYRLPTSSEWEYMVRRGGSQYCRYVFGNIAPTAVGEEMNYDRSGNEKLAPVGLFPQDSTIDQVLDVNGNTWEWMQDRGEQNYVPGLHQAGIIELVDSDLRYRRGGGWHDVSAQHRTSARSCISAHNRYDDTGFRVMRRRAPIAIKGKLPDSARYRTSLADVYAKYDSDVSSRDETNRQLENYAHRFALPVNSDIVRQLFPDNLVNPTSLSVRPLPILENAPRKKFELNLYYQDSRIKLAVEEKLGAHADAAQYQLQASDLQEVVANLLSTVGIAGRAVWRDLTDNDLEALTIMILDCYHPGRIEKLLTAGYATNERALAGLLAMDNLTSDQLIQYQIFAGTIWWLEREQNPSDQFPNLGKLEIDDRKFFLQDVMTGRCGLIFFFDDNGELVWDLALILRLLKTNPSIRITGVVSSRVVFNNASVYTVRKCLEFPIFREILESPRFELFDEDNPRPAIDPLFCSEVLRQRMKDSDIAFIKGIASFETMQNLPIDAYFGFVVHSIDSQVCTGLKADSGVFVRIPRGRSGYYYEKQTLREIYPTLTSPTYKSRFR